MMSGLLTQCILSAAVDQGLAGGARAASAYRGFARAASALGECAAPAVQSYTRW